MTGAAFMKLGRAPTTCVMGEVMVAQYRGSAGRTPRGRATVGGGLRRRQARVRPASGQGRPGRNESTRVVSPSVPGPGDGRDTSGPASCIPDVSEPTQRPARPVDPSDQRIRRSWFAFGIAYLALILVALARVVTAGATPLDWVLLILVGVAGVAAVVHALAVAGLDERRRDETESFARILSALSRSVSPDAIVDAIVEELSHATDADHIVVVRRRPDTRVLEARLVSSRQGIPDSTTLLPIADLEDPLPSEAGGGASGGAARGSRAGRSRRARPQAVGPSGSPAVSGRSTA